MHINKKIASAIAATLMLGTVLVGCGNGNSGSEKVKHTAALVTDGGSIDDKSFNQSAWEGLEAWGKENKLEKGVNGYNYAQSNSDADFTPNINKLIKAKYSTIFGIGYKLAPAIKKTAKQNPKTNFVIIDDVVSGKNVASVTFKSEQSSFLAGVAAAETTKTNKVGFLGGVKSDVITTFEKGFIQGVHAVNPKITVDVKYAGSFTKADLGQSMATAMYNNGEDVIFHAAGGTGAGAFTAAKNLAKNGKKVWVIGVDQDQKADGAYKGGNVTLASAVKEVGNAAKDIANKAMKDKFPGGKVVTYDLKSKGVDLVNDNMSDSAWKVVQQYEQKIIKGDLTVKAK
ncbi:BMP family lipoprotein [Ligilactobacillus ruminis]|jgi:basic membrane protein A|uniref:ABC superfamily ATP binding cassette transporter, binding protein n=3 Tax=Ligilactobacillus ruminis TaxID=1623 RepID=G2SMV4_LIGR2|nr:BMP family protein [Ligilactobacillus ruminis]AEN79140.1 ABC superfamily ATP binding cassette transporter, binding protein [Ligilactobacillus ruminis ATCC 27782]KLA46804.1 ABC transporter binding protein [Ligilactobacillus ruminis]KRM81923.1 ABC transporter binding protein [Ligilactobacillus ruminis DSM 20403 = NBRC 102161]SFG53812.1 basic membrane protein A [Ligilactobacillus ruminis DSM 20403 = NBRC 102161]